jgi:hyperosmotically inducible periplasmic protein
MLALAIACIRASACFHMKTKPGTAIAALRDSAGPSGLAPFPSLEEESQMKLTRTARTILSVTALAWAIPLAQAGEGKETLRAGNAKFIQLDVNADGFLTQDEVKQVRGYAGPFTEADANRDGKLDENEFLKAESLHDRAYAGRVANDSAITAKVKAALLREPALKSLDVSVETYRGEVLLSGFVKDETQRTRAVKAAATIAGVTGVKDGLVVRN